MRMMIVLCVLLVLLAGSGLLAQDHADSTSLFPLSPERQVQLESYSMFVNIWRFVSFGVEIGALALILFTGLSAKFRDWAGKLKYKWLVFWSFLALFLIADYLLNLPFAIYRSFAVEHDYGFSNQTFWEWWSDDLLALAVNIVILIIPMVLFYWLVRKTKQWWAWFSVAILPVVVFFVVIAPVFISPLFNDYTPLKDQVLKTKILSLADTAGIHGSKVFEVDASKQSNKINAYVTGLFNTKRIVLYDTMIRNFTTEEILFVMAHEMGHYVMNHVWWGVLLAMVGLVALLRLIDRISRPLIRRFSGRFGFDKLEDIASLPLVLLLAAVINFVASPIGSAVSRFMEHQSDAYAVEMTTVDGETAARTFEKLSAYNLSDPNPPAIIEFWFYSHPSLSKRIAFVEEYVKQRPPR